MDWPPLQVGVRLVSLQIGGCWFGFGSIRADLVKLSGKVPPPPNRRRGCTPPGSLLSLRFA